MSEILFATWDGGGNVPPAVAIATVLQQRGETVRFIGHETQRQALIEAGFAFTSYDGVRPFSAVEANSVPRLVSMFTDKDLGRAVLAELERRPADVVVVDCLLVPILRALADSGQRYVSLEHLFDRYLRRSWLKGPVGLVARLKRLAPVESWNEAALTLVATAPSLDPGAADPQPANVRFIGPALALPAPHDPAPEPAVLVSLSTFRYPGMGPALQRILDATARLDARVIVTTGPVLDPSELHTAANHEVHRYVPHDELMPQVSLVVGHGGHATTMRALAHGLPMVIMPMHPMLDQPMVGRAVADAGAGEVVKKKAGPDQLRPVFERLLHDGPHREAARRLAAEIRELDGVHGGADLVQGVLAGNGAQAR